jgi:hypothetical protein
MTNIADILVAVVALALFTVIALDILRRSHLWRKKTEGEEWMNEMGFPRKWVVCPSCSAMNWRIPPHNFESCPLVLKAAEAAGLKFDAERNMAVRTGVHMEELTRLIREQMEGEE